MLLHLHVLTGNPITTLVAVNLITRSACSQHLSTAAETARLQLRLGQLIIRNMVSTTENNLFEQCLQQAKLALDEKEVAIGCVFYDTELEKVLARRRNSVNITKNATRHAELNCIDDTVAYCKENNLDLDQVWPRLEVYVSCEPCIMCARILRHLKVKRVVYGCSNDRFGGCRSVLNVASNPELDEANCLEYTYGIREDEAIDLLKIFYSGENMNAPEEMRKIKKMRSDVSSS